MIGNINNSTPYGQAAALAAGCAAATAVKNAGGGAVVSVGAGAVTTLLTSATIWLMHNCSKPSVRDAVRKASGFEASEQGLNIAKQLIRDGADYRDAAGFGATAICSNVSHETVIATIAHIVISNQPDPRIAGFVAGSIVRHIQGTSPEAVVLTAAVTAGAAAIRSGLDSAHAAFSVAIHVTRLMVPPEVLPIAENAGRQALQQGQSIMQIAQAVSNATAREMVRQTGGGHYAAGHYAAGAA